MVHVKCVRMRVVEVLVVFLEDFESLAVRVTVCLCI